MKTSLKLQFCSVDCAGPGMDLISRVPSPQCIAHSPPTKMSEPRSMPTEASNRIFEKHRSILKQLDKQHLICKTKLKFSFDEWFQSHFLIEGAGLASTQTRVRPNAFHFLRQVTILQRAGGGSAERQFAVTLSKCSWLQNCLPWDLWLVHCCCFWKTSSLQHRLLSLHLLLDACPTDSRNGTKLQELQRPLASERLNQRRYPP